MNRIRLNDTLRTSGSYTFTTQLYYKKGDSLVESGLIVPITNITK